jgi:hypothetical protein
MHLSQYIFQFWKHSLFEGCLHYRLQAICHISDDVFHCLKSSSFKSVFELRE